MTRIVLINSRGPDPRFETLAMHNEPAQFLGMRSSLVRAGHKVITIDALGEKLTAKEVVKQTLAACPDVVGVNGYISRYGTVIDFDQEVLDQVRDSNPDVKTIIGGAFTARPEIRSIAVKRLNPDFAVIGEGEIPMEALIRTGFSSAGLETDPLLMVGNLDGTLTLRAKQRVDLDAIDFTRPPEWFKYIEMSLDWQRGCFGNCGFCAGYKMPATYKTPIRAVEELDYLMRHGKRMFFQIGPTFTADQEKATAIIDALNQKDVSAIQFIFEARTVEMVRIYREFLDPWLRFATANQTLIYIGYESGIPERLVNLDKVETIEQGQQYLPGLMDLLDQKYPFNIFIAWMLLDHRSTPGSALFDLFVMYGLLKKYDRSNMNPPSLLNNFTSGPGIRLSQEAPEEWQNQAPPPIGKLHDRMDVLATARKPGPLSKALAKILNASSSYEFKPGSFQVKMLKMSTLFTLQQLAEYLIKNMTQGEIDQARSEVQSITKSIGDPRVTALVDDSLGILK